jgi:murein DD-endopeptidase MepM/ murein hydrolase activator NlpD
MANNCRVLESGSYRVTSPYGTRTINGRKEFHYGIDIVKYYASY